MTSPPPPPDNDPPPAADDDGAAPPAPGEWAAPRADQAWPADDAWPPPPPASAPPPPAVHEAPEGMPQWDRPAEPSGGHPPPEQSDAGQSADEQTGWEPGADEQTGGEPGAEPAAWDRPAEQQTAWDQRAETSDWEQDTETSDWEQDTETSDWEQDTETSNWEQDTETSNWEQDTETSNWDQPAETSDWEQDAEPAAWDQPAETSDWEQDAEPAAWDQPAETSDWEQDTETSDWERAAGGGTGADSPPPADPWMPSGFRPDWTIEPAPEPAEPPGPGEPWPDPAGSGAQPAAGAGPAAGLWPPGGLTGADTGAGADEVPPPSPAYSPPLSAAYADDDAPGPGPVPPVVARTAAPHRPTRRRALVGALAVLAVLVAGAVALVVRGGDRGGAFAFGTVAAAGDGAQLVPGAGQQARALAENDTLRAGAVVKTAGDAAVTVGLDGGGVVRFDKGATVRFLDLAVDPETGRRRGASRPALQVDGGRVWVNPGGALAPRAVRLRLAGGEVVSRNNPVAVDCTVSCRVEAPAGGATFTSASGTTATPGANEAIDVEDPEHLDLVTSSAPSEWARQNLTADKEDLVPQPLDAEGHGVKDSALVDGAYRLSLGITGPPRGDDIPDDLKHRPDERGTTTLMADGGDCVTVPCDVTVRGDNGAKGTARVADGTVTVTLTQPIPCKGPDGRTIIPDIGTSTLKVTLEVLDATPDGKRWLASSLTGKGTLASTLSTPCSAGETLGTSTSPIAVSATPVP